MVVLAVDVGSDRSADGDVARAGRHRHEPAHRDDIAEHRVERDTGFDVERSVVEVGIDYPIERRAVEEDPTSTLRGIAVGAPEAAGKHRRLRFAGGHDEAFEILLALDL